MRLLGRGVTDSLECAVGGIPDARRGGSPPPGLPEDPPLHDHPEPGAEVPFGGEPAPRGIADDVNHHLLGQVHRLESGPERSPHPPAHCLRHPTLVTPAQVIDGALLSPGEAVEQAVLLDFCGHGTRAFPCGPAHRGPSRTGLCQGIPDPMRAVPPSALEAGPGHGDREQSAGLQRRGGKRRYLPGSRSLPLSGHRRRAEEWRVERLG
jgi:hypothetical protein